MEKIKLKIKYEDIENAVNGTLTLISQVKSKENILLDQYCPIFMQINSFKMPKIEGLAKRIFRVLLNYSIHPEDADVCLIVPEIKGISKREHEEHVKHYEEMFASKGVTGIKKIMTFHEFRTEYDTYELKNRLVNLYDVFLVDGRISGKVVHKCGKIFYEKRKLPVAVGLSRPNWKERIDLALRRSFINLSFKGDSHTIQVGNNRMEIEHIIDNVYSVVKWINERFPGSFDNIRSLYLFSDKTSWIPFYVSIKNPNDVKVPVVKTQYPKMYNTVTGELSTLINADVAVKPSGEVIVKRKAPTKEETEFLHGSIEGVPNAKKRKIKNNKKKKIKFIFTGKGSQKSV